MMKDFKKFYKIKGKKNKKADISMILKILK